MKVKNFISTSLIAALFAIVFTMSAMGQSSTTVVVTPTNSAGWGFLQETPNGTGSLVVGPSTPPLGIGSANLIVDSTGAEILGEAAYGDVQLSDITKLRYSTYKTSGSPALAIALQFAIDYDNTDSHTGFQGRLVYEPYHTQTVATGVWQTWDTLNDSAGTGAGNWWFSPGSGFRPGAVTCPQSNPCTWAQVNSLYPNASIRGAVYLKAGGGWIGGFDGNADALTIGVNGDDITYDFEPYSVATNKDQCKNGGFANFKRADGSSFKNQGDCVSYTQNGK